MKQLTQVLMMWHAAILLLCLVQLTQALTTPTFMPTSQPKLVGLLATSTTAKSQTQPQQPQQAQKKQDPKCLQPLETGPCRMSLDRYYYNKDKNICEPFKYGGCKGNDNRWGFKQTCEEACLIGK